MKVSFDSKTRRHVTTIACNYNALSSFEVVRVSAQKLVTNDTFVVRQAIPVYRTRGASFSGWSEHSYGLGEADEQVLSLLFGGVDL